MPSSRFSQLKKGGGEKEKVEEDVKVTKKEKKSLEVELRRHQQMPKTKPPLFCQQEPARTIWQIRQGASLRPLLAPRLLFLPPSTHPKEKKEKTFPQRGKDLLCGQGGSRQKPFLFKCNSVNRFSTDDPNNFPNAPGVVKYGWKPRGLGPLDECQGCIPKTAYFISFLDYPLPSHFIIL